MQLIYTSSPSVYPTNFFLLLPRKAQSFDAETTDHGVLWLEDTRKDNSAELRSILEKQRSVIHFSGNCLHFLKTVYNLV